MAMQFKNLYIYFSFLPSFLALPYAFELILLSVIRSTYSTVFNLIQFVLISHLRANNGLLLVIVFIGLLSPSIYLTLAISRLLYNQRRHIILIISLFSCVVSNLIRHLQIDLESIQRISSRLILSCNLTVALITAPILKLWAIAYNSEANTLLVILLHLTKDQWTIFTLFNKSASTKIYLICDKRSLLFINKELVNINN